MALGWPRGLPLGSESHAYEDKAREFSRLLLDRPKDLKVFTDLDDHFAQYHSILCSMGKEEAYAREMALFDGIVGWFDRKFLGYDIKILLDAIPPLMLLYYDEMRPIMKDAGISRFVNRLEEDEAGLFIPKTNKIILLPTGGENDRKMVMAHEILHYCNELGCGGEMRALDNTGISQELENDGWLDEGMTELHAQQKARKKGVVPTYISYEDCVMASLFIQRLAGSKLVKHAYLHGDYTKVRDILDKKIGYGKFDQMVKMKEALDALVVMAKEAGRRGFEHLFQECGIDWKRPFRKESDVERAVTKALEENAKP